MELMAQTIQSIQRCKEILLPFSCVKIFLHRSLRLIYYIYAIHTYMHDNCRHFPSIEWNLEHSEYIYAYQRPYD